MIVHCNMLKSDYPDNNCVHFLGVTFYYLINEQSYFLWGFICIYEILAPPLDRRLLLRQLV